MKKALKILAIVIGFLVLIFIAVLAYNYWRIQTGRLIKWDNQWYTPEELKEKYPPQYIDVPAKNTPEEVYANFRQALLDDDIEKALGYIKSSKKEKYREEFKEALEEYKKLPEVSEIRRAEKESYGNFANYRYFLPGQTIDDIPYEIDFAKNSLGFWEIESI